MQVRHSGAEQLSSLVAVAGAVAIARSGSLGTPRVLVVLALAGAVILLSFTACDVVGLVACARPVSAGIREPSGHSHPLGLALYQAPPLVFLLWTPDQSDSSSVFGVARPLGFVDVLPAAYFLFVLGSISITGQVSVTSLKYAYREHGDRNHPLLLLGVRAGAVSRVEPRGKGTACSRDGRGADEHRRRPDRLEPLARHEVAARTCRSATLGDPAALGTFIGMGIVLALGVLVWKGPRQLRPLAIGTVAVGLPGLFFTYTRGPIMGTIVAASLVLLSRTGSRLLAVCVLALMVVTISLSWGRLTSSELYHRSNYTSAHRGPPRRARPVVVEACGRRPLFGWGYGSFDRVVRSSDFGSGTLSRKEVIANTSHNTFLTILVEYGSIGLALFVVPWLVIGDRALAVQKIPRRAAGCCSGALPRSTLRVRRQRDRLRFFSFVPAVPWLLLGFLRRQQARSRPEPCTSSWWAATPGRARPRRRAAGRDDTARPSARGAASR